jgi:hypothetical protein
MSGVRENKQHGLLVAASPHGAYAEGLGKRLRILQIDDPEQAHAPGYKILLVFPTDVCIDLIHNNLARADD